MISEFLTGFRAQVKKAQRGVVGDQSKAEQLKATTKQRRT